MKKESVNKFDLEAAFKALEEIEIPVVKGIKPNRENLQEKFTKKSTTEVLVEDYFDVNDQSDLEAAQEEREAEIAKAKLARIEKIVDLDAESEEDLLPSYVGKFIIQCPQCMTLFYKNQEDIEKSEENPEVVNINEICQHCGNSSGYTLIGKVDNVGEEEAENYDVEDFDENELNLDFDAEEPVEEESTEEEPVEDETAEEGNEEELELEPVEETEEEKVEEALRKPLTEGKVVFVKGIFTPGEEGGHFEGYHNPEYRWNGWYAPGFEKAECDKIVSSINKAVGEDLMYYDAEKDAYVEIYEPDRNEPPYIYEKSDCETTDGHKQLYFIGDGWTWELVEDSAVEESLKLNESEKCNWQVFYGERKDLYKVFKDEEEAKKFAAENSGEVFPLPIKDIKTGEDTIKRALTEDLEDLKANSTIVDYVEYKHSYCHALEPKLKKISYCANVLKKPVNYIRAMIKNIIKESPEVRWTDKEQWFMSKLNEFWPDSFELYKFIKNSIEKARDTWVYVDADGELVPELNKDMVSLLVKESLTEEVIQITREPGDGTVSKLAKENPGAIVLYATNPRFEDQLKDITKGSVVIIDDVERLPAGKDIKDITTRLTKQLGCKVFEITNKGLNEAVDKELDDKLKAHNEYIEYLKEEIEKAEKALEAAKNDFVKKSIQSKLDALKADLEAALPEALKGEVETELPTAEEIELEATENTEEKEETKESLNKSLNEGLLDIVSDNLSNWQVKNFSRKSNKIAKKLYKAQQANDTKAIEKAKEEAYDLMSTTEKCFRASGIELSPITDSQLNKFCDDIIRQAREDGVLDESLNEDVKIISDLSDYTPWSGAVDTWNQIKDENKVDELDAMLEELYPDGLTMTELNDILWFDSEWVLSSLGIIEEVEESLTETTEVKPRIRHQSRREIFSRELATHPAFEGISTRDLERYIIDLYLEDDPTAELDVEQVVEYVEDLGWGKIILDNIDTLSEGQIRHFAQKDPVFVSIVKEFLGDWLIPNKDYSVGALVSELLAFLGKKPADREEAKDFKFDPNDASYKEFKDELADAYYEAKRAVPVGEALVGDVNINLDARGQSVGLLKGQGGEVHNDMTEDKENLDEFIGPAVASIAGAAGAASVAKSAAGVVDSLVSEDVEGTTKVRKGSKVEYLAMELAKQDFFKGISVQIIQRILIPSYIEEFGRDSLTVEEVTKYFSDYGFGGFVLDNYFDLSLQHVKTLGKQDPRFVETLRKYCEKHGMTPDEADYEKGHFNEFEELFDLSIGTVFEANGELETIEELQDIYKELVLVTESLQESGDLDTLLDSEEFKKPISEAEVENILAKYESLEEDVEPGIESELAIQDIVDTWESVEEIDEESLDKLTENYLTEVYSNVKSFKTTDCSLAENKLVVEGKITFNSGKSKSTKFIYEATKTADNKVVLEGLNADFATEKAFVLNCNLDTANRLVVESLNYKYTINNTLVEGLTK